MKAECFTDEEEAQVSTRVVLSRTPGKRPNNINVLLYGPEGELICKKKLNRPSAASSNQQRATPECTDSSKVCRLSSTTKKILFHRAVKTFFKSGCVARQVPHSRFSPNAGPGYAMLMTLKEAHALFCKENPELVLSFNTFADLRPQWVWRLGTVPLETCLCVLCTNVGAKVSVLNKMLGEAEQLPKESQILKFTLCPFKGDWPKKECFEGECPRCRDLLRPFTVRCREIFFLEVSWTHCERREKEGKVKLEMFQKSGTVSDLFEELDTDLHQPIQGKTFTQHIFIAFWQKRQFHLCRDSLKEGQVMLVQDFAENQKATSAAEVKTAHFGKQQVSLHTTVCFFRDADGQLVRHVHMFLSDDITRDYHAVHQFTLKSVELLRKDTQVREVILWSNGAASQYKGKGSFADVTLYPFECQRNYFGSKHSKAEADGETGRFAKAMKRAVGKGQNLKNAADMAAFGASIYPNGNPLKKYHFLVVAPEEMVRDRPETDVGALPGSRSLHQAVGLQPHVMKTRNLSCFCTACVEGRGRCAWSHIVSDFQVIKMKSRTKIPAVGEQLHISGQNG